MRPRFIIRWNARNGSANYFLFIRPVGAWDMSVHVSVRAPLRLKGDMMHEAKVESFPHPPRLTEEDYAGLKAFWEVHQLHTEEVSNQLIEKLGTHSSFGPVLRNRSNAEMAAERQRSRELGQKAIYDKEWQPFLTYLQAQGKRYAEMNVVFGDWFEVITLWRPLMLPYLREAYQNSWDTFTVAISGMGVYIDIAMASIGEAYLDTKEALIHRQQEAIAELSTPVLQLREGLLLLPVVGMIDSRRALLLTETLLHGIRAARAKVVVMDITGVPLVDSKVANHLVQSVEASRLMGARVIMTGLSPEIAQALVAIGTNLRGIRTLGDLQNGIEEAERLLGRTFVRDGKSPAAEEFWNEQE